ncbi:ADP-ribosylglycohydrolase [Pelomyxa schiedti]|nr:ADP-ribosylglycohydrolase [Pelomyxa schiedti]
MQAIATSVGSALKGFWSSDAGALPECGMERRVSANDGDTSCTEFPGLFYALVGMALGDSLGAPFENKDPRNIAAMWPTGSPYPSSLHPCGLIWTDDTQMSLSFMEVYMTHKKMDIVAIWKIWAEASRIKLFEQNGQPLARQQFGLFRGTGKNFRQSVDTAIASNFSSNCSSPSAGNGAAMRVTPLSVIAFLKRDEGCLAEMIFVTSTMTHQSVMGIAPAFSFGYTLYTLMDNPSQSAQEAFQKIVAATRKFEDYLESIFRAKDTSYSTFLGSLLDGMFGETSPTSPKDKFSLAQRRIVNFASMVTQKPIQSPNDGLAVASVTTAIVAGLLFKHQPFLGTLQLVYQLGGDTDTVGAMLGAILGCSHSNISSFITNQLICSTELLKFFKSFISVVSSNRPLHHLPWIDLEKKVVQEILSFPNGMRNNHYNSTSSGGRRYNDNSCEYFSESTPTYFSNSGNSYFDTTSPCSNPAQQNLSTTTSLSTQTALTTQQLGAPGQTLLTPQGNTGQCIISNTQNTPAPGTPISHFNSQPQTPPPNGSQTQTSSLYPSTSVFTSRDDAMDGSSRTSEVNVAFQIHYIDCKEMYIWIHSEKCPRPMSDDPEKPHYWATMVQIPAATDVLYHFIVRKSDGSQLCEDGAHSLRVAPGKTILIKSVEWNKFS